MRNNRDVRIRGHRFYIWRLRHSLLRKEFHARVADRVADFSPTGWIVDVGCGPGLLEAHLTSRVRRDRVVGVDIDRRMLRITKSEQGTEAIQATSARLPFRDDSVDFVVSTASLKDWGDRKTGLSEIVRVLKPAATGLVYDFVTQGVGSQTVGFARRFGIVSDLLRRSLRLTVRLTIEDVRGLLSVTRLDAVASVDLEADLGVVGVILRKPA